MVSKWTLQIGTFITDGQLLCKHANSLLTKAGSDTRSQSFKLTVAVLKGKVEALSIVFVAEKTEANELAFNNYISQIQNNGTKPPIQKYLDLKLAVNAKLDGETRLAACASAAAAKDMLRDLNGVKVALQDLITASKGACTDLERAINGAGKVSKLAEALTSAAALAAPGGGPPRKEAASSRFEIAMTHSVAIPVYSDPMTTHDCANVDMDSPFLVKSVAFTRTPKTEALTAVCEQFKLAFSAWKSRATLGRSGRPVKDTALAADLTTCFSKYKADGVTLELTDTAAANQGLVDGAKVSTFGMAENMDFFSTEVDRLGTYRVALEGVRTVFMAPLNQIDHMLRKKLTPPAPPEEPRSVTECLSFLENLTKDDITAFAVAQFQMYAATVGPHDLLYTPPGYAVGVQVFRQQVIGFAMGTMPKGCSVSKSCVEWSLLETEKHNKPLVRDKMIALKGQVGL